MYRMNGGESSTELVAGFAPLVTKLTQVYTNQSTRIKIGEGLGAVHGLYKA